MSNAEEKEEKIQLSRMRLERFAKNYYLKGIQPVLKEIFYSKQFDRTGKVRKGKKWIKKASSRY